MYAIVMLHFTFDIEFKCQLSFYSEDAENVGGESVVFNSPPLFFQGELCARSPSPFGLYKILISTFIFIVIIILVCMVFLK